MGINSAIEWTDATWNPWQGCTKVSEACAHCYMFRDLARWGRDGSIVVRSKLPTFNLPLSKTREGRYAIVPGSKVFTCSWSDWFHVDADAWRPEAWEVIRQRPDVTFQIVTKRPERIADCLPDDWGRGWPNVWLIATVENHERCMERLQPLLDVPAAIRGLSCEPLLGPLDLGLRNWADIGRRRDDDEYRLDWVIVGGESGPHARPTHPDWVRFIRQDCELSRVPFFFKQWGEWMPLDEWNGLDPGRAKTKRIDIDGRDVSGLVGLQSDSDSVLARVGKKCAGRLLDGREYRQFPALITA